MIVARKKGRTPGHFPRLLGSRAGWTGRLPGGLVSAWYSPNAVSSSPWSGRRRGLLPSPETATSGQSPHVSYGYSKQDHLLSRVPITIRPGGAVRRQEL